MLRNQAEQTETIIGYLRWPRWVGSNKYDKCACCLTSGIFSYAGPLRYSANYHTGSWVVSSSDWRVLQRRPLSSHQCWSDKTRNRQKWELAILILSPGEAFSKKGKGPSFQTEKKSEKAGKIRPWELRVDRTLMSSTACLCWEDRERGYWRVRPEAGHCTPCSWRCSLAHGAPRMFLEGSKFNSFISARNPLRWVSALPVAYEREIRESPELSYFSEDTRLNLWAQRGSCPETIEKMPRGSRWVLRWDSPLFSLVPVLTLLDDFLTICITDQ